MFRIDEDYHSRFHFSLYEDEDSGDSYYVTLYCDKPISAFMIAYEDMTVDGLRTWASTHVEGNLNTIYNWEVLAPDLYSSPWPLSTMSLSNGVNVSAGNSHEGGSNA